MSPLSYHKCLFPLLLYSVSMSLFFQCSQFKLGDHVQHPTWCCPLFSWDFNPLWAFLLLYTNKNKNRKKGKKFNFNITFVSLGIFGNWPVSLIYVYTVCYLSSEIILLKPLEEEEEESFIVIMCSQTHNEISFGNSQHTSEEALKSQNLNSKMQKNKKKTLITIKDLFRFPFSES